MFEELSKNGKQRRYLYNPVGGGPFPYQEMEAPTGPVLFGDIVINSDEDVVIANSDASFDQLQDSYADDQITGGDEGLGYAQAKRLKRKLGRNKRRLRTNGTYAIEGGAPYQFGAAPKFNPVKAVAGGILGSVIGGFSPKISLKKSSAPGSNAATDDAANRARAGDASGLAFVVRSGGFTSNGGWHGAVGKGADRYARVVLQNLINEGVVVGPAVDPGHWSFMPNAWSLAKQSPIAIVATPPGVPAPAPTSSTTDVTGATLPASIMQASASQPAVGVNAPSAPTASESVAAASMEPETMDVSTGRLPSFDLGALRDPKVLLTLAGVGIFLFTQMGSKRRSRRRR